MLKIILSLIIFGVVMVATNILHFRYLPVDVVLYDGLLDVVIATIIAAVISWFFLFKKQTACEVFVPVILIFLLSGYIFVLTIPTIIDRSYSVYILEKLQQHDGKLRTEAFDTALTNAFMTEHRLTDVRLTEQLESGTIEIIDGCVSLTERGKAIASLTHWYRSTILPKHRLLMGEYSDDLTNPFRKTSPLHKYGC